MFKQINNVYEKDFNNRLKTLGITASQCAVLDYLFHSREEEVNQKDIEKALSLQNPTVTGLLKRLDEKGYILSVPSNKDKRLTVGLNKKEVPALEKMLDRGLYNIAEP